MKSQDNVVREFSWREERGAPKNPPPLFNEGPIANCDWHTSALSGEDERKNRQKNASN